MTGRDLIIYILKHDLEDRPVFENGQLLGFLNEYDVAVKFEVGIATIRVWYETGLLEGIKIGNMIYIPAETERPTLDYERKE